MNMTNVSNQGTSITNSQQPEEIKHQIAARGDSVLSGGISVLYMFMNLLSEMADAKYGEMKEKAAVARESQSMSNKVDAVIAEAAKGGASTMENLPPEVVDYMRKNDIKIGNLSIDDYLGKNAPSAVVLQKLLGKIDESDSDGMQCKSWDDVVKYMDKKGIKVDGQSCTSYIWHLPEVGERDGQKISKAHMQKIADTLAGAGGGDEGTLDQGKLKEVKAALATESSKATDFVSQSQLQLQKIMQTYNVTVSLLNSMQTMLAEMNKSIAQNIR